MKLKSPGEKPVHVALTSGHAICIGPEGREVPQMFRRQALADGAIPVGVTAEELDDSPPAPTEKDKAGILDREIKLFLEGDDPSNFVAGTGLPNRKKLSSAAGWNVTAEELEAAWAKIEAEAAAGQ